MIKLFKKLKLFEILLLLLVLAKVDGVQADDLLSNKRNGEWVTINGKVEESRLDYFVLSTGIDSIIVEVDDVRHHHKRRPFEVLAGDQVMVHGKIDQDPFERKKVEASTIYIKNQNKFIYGSSVDEEDMESYLKNFSVDFYTIPDGVRIEIPGVVEKIDSKGEFFYLDTGLRKIKVDISHLEINPLTLNGIATEIDKRDKVKVYGEVEKNFFSEDSIKANWVTLLAKK